MTFRLSRRAMLRGIGASGVAVSLPLLNAMGARSVKATPSLFPKRLVTFFTPNGFDRASRPTSLDFTGTTLAPLAPHASDLIVMRGLDMASAALDPNPNDGSHYHGWSHLLVGDDCYYNPTDSAGRTGGNVSFDMIAADHISTGTRFQSSLQTVESTGYALSWRAANEPVLPEDDPRAVFDRLFADLGVDPAALERARARQQSILDFTRDATTRLRCRLGVEDRDRVDAHLEAVRDVESRLDPTSTLVGGGLCAMPTAPGSSLSYPDAGRAHMDLLVMALTCDLTRVGSVQWSRAAAGPPASWLGHDQPHHELSHDTSAGARAKVVQLDQWYAQQFAYLLDRMKAVPEGDGTLLDHSVVLWVTEGSEAGHGRDDIDVVVAGSGAGALRTGQYLNLADRPHNDLLLELLNAVLPNDVAPYSTFGNPAACTGGVPEIRV